MTTYPCQHCNYKGHSLAELKAHMFTCEGWRARLAGLGTDLAAKVTSGEMKIDAAEAEQAKRPKLVL